MEAIAQKNTAAKSGKKAKTPAPATTDGQSYERNILVPLSLLVLSADNVGKTGRDEVDELAALIDSQGLLQPLLVKEEQRGEILTGNYEVVAGGRRLRALKLLAKKKRITKNELIECKRIDPDAAIEVSIAENSGRVEMHPADEFEAFKRLIDAGKPLEDVAARFGVSPLTVKRRLRLANVSPVLIAKYRADELSLEHLMVMAITDDHQLQESVWENASQWERTPGHLRQKLMQNELEYKRSPLAKFVGLEAYEQAGGYVRRDLFSADGEGVYIADPALLRSLAEEKLRVLGEEVKAEGWQWVQVRESFMYHERSAYGRTPAAPREATQEEADMLAALDKEADEIAAKLEKLEEADDYGDEYEALCERSDEIDTQRETIKDGMFYVSKEAMAQSGAVLTLDGSGNVEVHRGLIKPEDRATAAKALGQPDDGTGLPAKKAKPEFSEKLMFKLSAHRTAVMQTAMASNARVALVAVVHALLTATFCHYGMDSKVKVRGTSSRYLLTSKAEDMKDSRAWQEMEAKREALEARLPQEGSEYFGWLMTLTNEELLELLAYCAAITIDATTGKADEKPASELFAALNIDMADYWTPTAASYLADVPKAKVIEAVADSLGAEATAGLDKMKKAELLGSAEHKLAGQRWLPTPLRP